MPRIHPTAIMDRTAELAEDVEIGAYSVVEGQVRLGPGTVLRPHAVVRRSCQVGSGNLIDSFAVIGGEPQDHKFDPAVESSVRIGNDNVFREGVTISRATGAGLATVVGDRNYFMTCAHAGHNATVEDDCVLVNGAALAGHTVLGRRAILSAHVVVHQFCWVGEGVMSQGNAATAMHIPPYCILANVSRVVGLNLVGLRRATDIDERDRREVTAAFRLLYRSGLRLGEAVEGMSAHTEWGRAASSFREFVGRVAQAQSPYNRGIAPLRRRAEL